jgi:hypothetical protein
VDLVGRYSNPRQQSNDPFHQLLRCTGIAICTDWVLPSTIDAFAPLRPALNTSASGYLGVVHICRLCAVSRRAAAVIILCAVGHARSASVGSREAAALV